MITRQTVSQKLLAYLNSLISLAELVMYLAGADTDYFPLTWEVCVDFMQKLGTPVKVVSV